MPKRHNHRKRGLRGYRLHAARIDYSGGTKSMRTIKYPLIGSSTESGLVIEDQVFEAIVHDHRALWGITNFADFVAWQENRTLDPSLPERPHSFLGLWLLALRLGFVFNNANEVPSICHRLTGVESQGDRLFAQLTEQQQADVKKTEWINFVTKDTRGLDKKDETARRLVLYNLGIQPNDPPTWLVSTADSWVEGLSSLGKFDQNAIVQLKRDVFNLHVPHNGGLDVEKPPALPFGVVTSFPTREFSEWADDPTQLLDRMITYYKDQGQNQPETLFGIGGVSAGTFINGFYSQLFPALRKGEVEGLWQSLQSAIGLSDEAEVDVRSRLQELSDYATNLPEAPSLVSKWADYRADTDGTLQSWYSNLASKRTESERGVRDLLAAATEFKSLLEAKNLDDSEAYVDLLGLIDSIPTEFDDPESTVDVPRLLTDSIFAAQGALRSSVNELSQLEDGVFDSAPKRLSNQASPRRQPTEKSSKKVPLRKRLEARVQASPLFYGESQLQYFTKSYDARTLAESYIDQLQMILRLPLRDELISDKVVQQLAVASLRAEHPEVRAAYSTVARSLGVDFRSVEGKQKAFWVSRFARRKPEILQIQRTISVADLRTESDLETLLKRSTDDMDEQLLRDAVALSKIVTSAVLAASGDSDREKRKSLVTAHSELSGLVAILSKRKFIARYPVQAVSGAQVSLGRTLVNGHARYRYAFPAMTPSPDHPLETTTSEHFQWFNKDGQAIGERTNAKYAAVPQLQVASSKYQVQFLDWFFTQPSTKQTRVVPAGAFTIAEQDVEVDWSIKRPKVNRLTNDTSVETSKKNALKGRRRRVYTSQPFTLVPVEKVRVRPQRDHQFLGVDIGEYGLAWCAVSVNDGAVDVLDKGFIFEPGQRKLVADVRAMRQRQVRATFMSTDTHIARLRESLLGAYRAQLEDLSMRFDATLVFEFEVSAFESGGAKISKLYDSIKRSDVRGSNKAEAADNGQAWGDFQTKAGVVKSDAQLLPWAEQVTASGTSQTCTKCGRWATLAFPGRDEATRERSFGKVRAFDTSQGIHEVELAGQQLSDEEEKSIKSSIRAAMRPSRDGSGVDILREQLPSFDLAAYVKRRGNSAIYVCPYTDCQHIADADVQAAFNIAVRGYLKRRHMTQNTDRAKKDTPSYSVAWFEAEKEKLTLKPIGLE